MNFGKILARYERDGLNERGVEISPECKGDIGESSGNVYGL